MRKFYTGVVNHPKSIITAFMAVFVICLFMQRLVAVNYDMNDYLPESSPSTISLDVMEEEFDGGIPNARVMIRDVSIPEALEYKEKIEAIDGVTDVTWLDDSVDVTVPLGTLDQDVVETYYKDRTALFTVVIDEDKQLAAVDAIEAIIGEDDALGGDAVSSAVATKSTVSEINKIAAFAVVFVIFVLLLTTESWFEPVIILVGLGVAIIINAGTNLIFGEISFVSNAAGNILQLAVSMDYSVFLIHRFEECRQGQNAKEAMVDALCKSTSSILSSGLTTVIGFLALIFMKFGIGPDLGLVLAKGVTISLLSVFVFMPAFILSTYKWLDKTHHRSFMPEFRGLGKAIQRLIAPMILIFVLIVVPAYLASNSNDFYYGSSHIFGPETELGKDEAAITDVFGESSTYVLMVPKGNQSMEKQMSEEIAELPQVTDIISYVDTVGAEIPMEYLDEDTLSMLQSEHYSRMVISLSVPAEGKETFEVVEKIRAIAEKYYPEEQYLAGAGVSTYDLMDTVTADMIKVNAIAIGAVFVVLLLSLRSLVLPVILVVCIESAIWINLSVPYFLDKTIFYIAYLIISSIQLGATVDYAILMTDRYRENRETLPKKEALITTISNVTVSITTSGSVLTVVGLLLGYMSSHGLLAQLGMFIGRGAILSMIIVFFVLPGWLYIFDKLVVKKKKEAVVNAES
ncbi:MAG: RND family transporter [Lachnospiraceae bacterium]